MNSRSELVALWLTGAPQCGVHTTTALCFPGDLITLGISSPKTNSAAKSDEV